MRFKNPKTSTWDLIGASGGSSGESQIVFSKKADFPTVGKSDILYIDIEKNESYIYTDDYHLVGGSCNIVVVSALPDTLVAGKLYVNTSDKSITYYDGSNSTVILPETVDKIDDTVQDTDLANVKAIKDFVTAEITKVSANYTITLTNEAVAAGEKTKQTLKQGTGDKEKTIGTIVIPDLVMKVKDTPNNGYLKTYQFTYGDGVTFEIDIAKDLVVTGGAIISVTDESPIAGLENGKYLKLTIANQDEPVYIDVKDLGGENGITPHIGANNNWYIGDVDTGVSAVGKSIKSIVYDENKNIIVTFTDNTTQNIGKISFDVQADFLTEDGFGKLRYYNGHFQYYDENSDNWIDTSVTPENVYVMNMTPQPMKAMACDYDKLTGKLRIKFTEPDDTILDGQAFCIVEKVVIRRKLGSVPLNENDGDLVTEVLRRDFGSYSKLWYVDEGVTPEIGKTYYYKAFPMSTTGFYNYSELNEASITCKEAVLYGFKIDQNESDPASMISYLADCDNAQYASAYMDYTADTFNYGDWENAWFIAGLKPCMLKYDGTVDYELDKNDYTKKIDGTQSDVANKSYAGNAMIGFPKTYWKIVDNGDDTANVYISDTKIDDDFVCYSHIDNNGMEIDYCYMPAYTGSLVNGRLRSLSGLAPISGMTRQQDINYAKANNLAEKLIWYTEVYSDRMLLALLLLLIGKSTDTQTVFGTGNNNSLVSTSNTGIKNSGTMDTRGLFWGNQDNVSGVKVLGMENIWGNIWRPVAGWINYKGVQKVKMTYGQSDGSTTDGYNLDGTGYISIPNSTPSGTSGGYISKMLFTKNGLIPIDTSGSATTYYKDTLVFNNSQVNYAIVGGCTGNKQMVGMFYINLAQLSSYENYLCGVSISCKPLATS